MPRGQVYARGQRGYEPATVIQVNIITTVIVAIIILTILPITIIISC
jgi:hypothetical protein